MKKPLSALALSALTLTLSTFAFAADDTKAVEAKSAETKSVEVGREPAKAETPAKTAAPTEGVVEMAGMKYYLGKLVRTGETFSLESGAGDNKKIVYTLSVPEMFVIALKNTHKVNAERNPTFAIAGTLEEKDGKKTLSLQSFMLEDQLKQAMKIMDATRK